MAKSKRIVLYAINGAGMGHVTRLLAVAKWLRRYGALLDGQSPEVFFLTSSDASDILSEAGFAAFKIPSKTVARKTELNKLEYRRLAKHFVWNTLGVFSPDLLVVDTFPSGSFDELFQVLDGPFRKSFIHREVKPEYRSRATFRSAIRMYDAIVAPHSPDNFTDWQAGDQPIQCCGEVIQYERGDILERTLARKRLGVPQDCRLVYVSAGGGGDPEAERQIRKLVATFSDIENVHLLVGAGPLYRGERLAGSNVIWHDGPSVGKYFSAVDAAVCAAGYNTFHELLYARVPTAFFAQEKIADDQASRIHSAVEAGACRFVSDWNDEVELERTLKGLFESQVAASLREACEKRMPENGARQCAIQLLQPLYDSKRLEWASRVLLPELALRLEQLTGSSTQIGDWLLPLVPQDMIRSLTDHQGIQSLLSQLSESASEELSDLLSSQDDASDYRTFELQLIELLETISSFKIEYRSSINSDSLKTVLATIKKYPHNSDLEETWNQWSTAILSDVNQVLLQNANDVGAALEVLGLSRVFPRIVDATPSVAANLFSNYLSSKRDAGLEFHQIRQSIQLLKMKHTRMTTSVLEESCQLTSS